MYRFRFVHCLVVLALALHTEGCFLVVAGAAAGGAAGAAASTKESQREHHSPATYVGTVLADVFYVPGKVIFAAGGAVVSGVAYLVTLGDSGTSRSIWNASVNGDYVVTPRMMEGKEPVHFVGP
jgi:hypothetical protein